MSRFDYYRSPEAPPPKRRKHSVAWAVLCIGLELAALFWVWAVLI